MREFLGLTKSGWQERYQFLGFVNYCPECSKEANVSDKWEDGTTTTCFCDKCHLMWDHRYGSVFMGE